MYICYHIYMYTFTAALIGRVCTPSYSTCTLPCLFVWPCLLLSFFLLISHLKTCICISLSLHVFVLCSAYWSDAVLHTHGGGESHTIALTDARVSQVREREDYLFCFKYRLCNKTWCLFFWPCLLLSFFLLISHLKTCIYMVALPCLFVWSCLLLSFFLLISHLKTCTQKISREAITMS